MPDAHYTLPRLAAVYDSTCGWSEDRAFYLSLADRDQKRILDLACGTGLLTRAFAQNGHLVTGVDPAPAMLDIARSLDQHQSVEWIKSDAQTFRCKHKFDLIVMTGNAFQVFLEDYDVLAVLRTMKTHLKPGASAVFETRNPAVKWEERWNTDETVIVNGKSHQESRKVIGRKSDLIEFDTYYVFDDETLISKSKLRFHSVDELTALIEQVGLQVEQVWGDWRGERFDPGRSEEMVFEVTTNM